MVERRPFKASVVGSNPTGPSEKEELVENLKTQTNNSSERAEEIDRIDETLSQLPEVQAGRNIWQNDFHEYDVLTHTIQFVKHLKEISIEDDAQTDPDMIAAGWLHDIGKPVTAKPKTKNGVAQEREPGKPYHDFADHDNVGAAMVREMDPKMFNSLRLSQERIAQLVASHYLPMKGIKSMRKANSWESFLQEFTALNTALDQNNSAEEAVITKEEVLQMFLADKLAQGDPEKYCLDREELFYIRDALLTSDNHIRFNLLAKIYQLQRPGSVIS